MSIEIVLAGNDPELVLPTTQVIELSGKTGRPGKKGNDGVGIPGPPGEPGSDGAPGEKGEPGEGADLDEIIDLIDEATKDLEEKIDEIISDGYITPSEKLMLQLEIDRIIKEKPSITSTANLHQLDALYAIYLTTYDALMLYIGPILSNLTVTTSIVPSVFKAKFSDFYQARANLLKKAAENDFDNIEQTKQTLIGVEKITNFWKITLDDESGIIAAGTMLVGTPNYNNAGMTGVTDQGQNSVRFFAGAPYQQKDTAPFRVLNNGKWWVGDAHNGMDWNITTPNRLTIRGGLNVDAGGNTSEVEIYRGIYGPTITYYKGNTVTYQGSLWQYKNILAGNGGTPAENAYWTLKIAKGETGIGVEYRYQVNGSWETPPTAPSPSVPAPPGWSITIPSFTVGQYLWKISAQKDANGVMKSTWSGPFRETGVPGIKGDKGDQGVKGETGIPGTPGADGSVTYTWIKYANTPTTGMVDTWVAGKDYIGIAYNKPSATASTVYSDYKWSKFQGAQGVQGNPGVDGNPNYTWIKYADSPVGAGMSDNPAGKSYLGLAFNKTTPTESTTASDYTWSLMQGAQGPKGPYIIDMGVWKNTQVYQGTVDMLQMVQYGTTGYLTRSDAGTITAGTLPTNTTKWQSFQSNFESIYTKILVAVTANINNLVIGQLSSNNGLISLNLNNDNALKIRHDVPTKPEGIKIGVDENTGQPVIQAKDASGVLVWDLTMGGYTQYVTVIPEAWTVLKYRKMNQTATTPTAAQLNAMRTLLSSTTCTQSGNLDNFGITGDVTFHKYYAGQNPDTATNLQYEGNHTASVKSTSNWIADGWYMRAGYGFLSDSNNPGLYVKRIELYQGGKFIKDMLLDEIATASNSVCPTNFDD